MSVLIVNKENYEKEVLNETKPVIIDFYADWCGPCKMMAPIMESIATDVSEKAKVVKINIDENQELAMEYQVMSIPTIVIRKDGKITNTFVGVQEKDTIIEALKN